MPKKDQTRYIVKVSFHILAETDEEAIRKAKKWVKDQDDKQDNSPFLHEVIRSPFATLTVKTIYKKE